jgi:sterol 3beta-glucosyltransferase
VAVHLRVQPVRGPAAGWTPPADLERFLAAGPPPGFVGFGSRNPADAARLTAVVADARRQAGVRMVIQAGWADLGAALQDDDEVLVIGEAPHDWLFPKMAAVVHHAGAGTTAAGLRAGTPTVSVPMITDQPFWASRVTALGAGPQAVPYKKLTAEALGAAISDAVTRDWAWVTIGIGLGIMVAARSTSPPFRKKRGPS